MTASCNTCHFSAPSGTGIKLCRRYPPKNSQFPFVERDWWCGEWSATGAVPITNVDVLDNFRARCPGCGNLKGRRHNQGCPHIVRNPARMKP